MLVLLSGVSGAGKDTIKKEIMKRLDYVVSLPSVTDRSPREGEVQGNPYDFVTTEEFERMIHASELYEYDVHHEHYYGTSKKYMNDKIAEGKVIIKDMDVNGTENLIRILKDDVKVVTIFLKVPKQILEERLLNREEKPSMKEIQLRLNRFDYEESKIGLYDYVIKNNDLEKTVQIIIAIIENELKLKGQALQF